MINMIDGKRGVPTVNHYTYVSDDRAIAGTVINSFKKKEKHEKEKK